LSKRKASSLPALHGFCDHGASKAAGSKASRITWYGEDPFPVLLGAYASAMGLILERRALGEAKIAFIESYAKAERVPDNLSGPRFHQNLFLQMLYGDPSLQLR
jgi:hypothetical protein